MSQAVRGLACLSLLNVPTTMDNQTVTVTLDTPIKRGEQVISDITLRKPGAGELRGVSLMDLMRMEVAALHTVLPRITTPTLTTADVSKMDPADLTQLASEVSGFLLPKRLKEDSYPSAPTTPSPTLQ